MTIIIPDILTGPDLRITYSIIGIYGIDRRTIPVRFRITEATLNAELFSVEIEAALAVRFLLAGDVLVMGDAVNHCGKENTVLADWLWKRHRVFTLFLPAWAPEWNPIELVWSCLEARLRTYKLKREKCNKDRGVYAATDVLTKITHQEVESFCNKSGVFDNHGY